MKTSAAGRAFIEKWEEGGVAKLHPYDDGVGVLTIGFGHTSAAGPPPVVPGMTITAAQADAILSSDLGKVEADVNRLVTVPLSQLQFNVLVSWHFNCGGLGRSTLLRKLNAGDYAAVPDELAKWVMGGGRVLLGLQRRRAAEAKLWSWEDVPAPPVSPKPGKPPRMPPPPLPTPAPPPAAPAGQSWLGRAVSWLEETHTW